MKNIITKITLGLFVLTFLSCGPSAEERAAMQRHRDDSIATAVKQKVESEERVKKNISILKKNLTMAIAELEVANDEMGHLKEFHLLRTSSERDEQIRSQSIKIQDLTNNIEQMRVKLSENESMLSSN